jgi:hypothetical protein
MKCANCKEEAVYIYRLTSAKSINYCKKDLPKFLDERRKAGLLETTSDYKAMLVEGQKSIAVVYDEPVAELVEELVVEAPKVEKKAAKKKAE